MGIRFMPRRAMMYAASMTEVSGDAVTGGLVMRSSARWLRA
jgi:hypothetical protein